MFEKNGFGSVGRTVDSETRGPGFTSSHRNYLHTYTFNCYKKDKTLEKEAGHDRPIYVKNIFLFSAFYPSDSSCFALEMTK